MHVDKLQMDKDQAAELHREYQQHRGQMNDADRAIAAIYKRIGQGKMVIRALSSITAAGLDAQGLPRLAIMRADERKVMCRPEHNVILFTDVGGRSRSADRNIKIPMPGAKWETRSRTADVPLIPVHLRPRKAVHKYHVLWEAEWSAYPVDPYLLRRMGEDAWIVVAAWDLTVVERAVMSSRLNG